MVAWMGGWMAAWMVTELVCLQLPGLPQEWNHRQHARQISEEATSTKTHKTSTPAPTNHERTHSSPTTRH